MDSDLDESDYSNTHSDSESDSENSEFWENTSYDQLDEGISTPPAIPEPATKQNKLHKVHALLQWMLYFLLIWKSITHLSENGLTWLLQSIFHFLQELNIHIPDEILVELIAILPCSLHMVRKYLGINRDNFIKYVVCPKLMMCV